MVAREKKLCFCGCGEWFIPRRGWAKFKSKKHAQEHWSRLLARSREIAYAEHKRMIEQQSAASPQPVTQ